MLKGYAARPPGSAGRRISLKFLRSPLEILGDGEDGPVTGIRLAINRLEDGRAVPTGDEEVIGCGLVLRSIGYRGRQIDDIPFDERRALIRNEGGRVCDEDGSRCDGEYAVGWIKRGPSGVIGTNKKDATETVALLLDDARAGHLPARNEGTLETLLEERGVEAVLYAGWEAIDSAERGAGEPHGRPRIKLCSWDALLAAARAT
jgi:ferredoxin--NADP+ reductase